MLGFDAFPDDCCQTTALVHVAHMTRRGDPPPHRRVMVFTCPTCEATRVLTLRPDARPEPKSSTLVLRDDLYHRLSCPEAEGGEWFDSSDGLDGVFVRTLLRDGRP